MLKRLPVLLPLLLAATPPAIQAEDWGPLFRGAHMSVEGMDGAYSVPIEPGVSLWSFGDTLVGSLKRDSDRHIAFMPFNTAAWVYNADLLHGAGEATFINGLKPILPATANKEERVWPLDLVAISGKLWHYYVVIAPTGGQGALDFKVIGTGVASAKVSRNPRFTDAKQLWPGDAPSFGGSVMQHAGWLYLYAGGGETHLARVRPEAIDRPEAYAYFAGAGRWAKRWQDAAALPGSGPEPSVRWNAYLKRFVMVYVPPFGKTIEARFAPAPEGPWSEPTRVADCQPATDPEAMFYGAKQHAELDVDGGRRVFVTYNTNAPPPKLAERPDLYWPRLVRVTFTADAGR